MRWLRRADLGTEEIAYRTAQDLYSLHRSRRPRNRGTGICTRSLDLLLAEESQAAYKARALVNVADALDPPPPAEPQIFRNGK
jgi:hypothetical protein